MSAGIQKARRASFESESTERWVASNPSGEWTICVWMFACGQARGYEPLREPAGADVADDGVHVADEEQEAEIV